VNKSPRIIVALDFPDAPAALDFAGKLSPDACRVKVGKELFTAAGPAVIEKLVDRGFDVFLDLKFHDIPNTVAAAVSAAANLGVWMLNVHTLGGRRMLEAARNALAHVSRPPLLIAVTILTSMDRQALSEVGLQGSPGENVLRLARLARAAGLLAILMLTSPALAQTSVPISLSGTMNGNTVSFGGTVNSPPGNGGEPASISGSLSIAGVPCLMTLSLSKTGRYDDILYWEFEGHIWCGGSLITLTIAIGLPWDPEIGWLGWSGGAETIT